MRIGKPFKKATPMSKTQGFWQDHQANDFASFFGDFLVAPFNAKVTNIRGVEQASDIVAGDNTFLEQGAGIKLTSIEDPTLSISYWHCQEVFPVNRGDTVLQGQPVAQMGNTGYVMSGGQVVPYDVRLKPPYPGTHVHITMGRQVANTYTPLDYSSMISWDLPVNYDTVTTIKALIAKMMGFLKK